MNGKTLLNFNFKGGVGKTTLTVMENLFIRVKWGKNTTDRFRSQGNATEIMKETYKADLKSGNFHYIEGPSWREFCLNLLCLFTNQMI